MGFSPLHFLAARGDKHEAAELFVLIAIPLVLSFLLLKVAQAKVMKGGSPKLRWAALVPLAFGLYLSWAPFADIRSENYRSFHSVSDRSVMLHYLSFFVPLGASLLLLGWLLWQARKHKLES